MSGAFLDRGPELVALVIELFTDSKDAVWLSLSEPQAQA
jgi:hypothetical protein